MTPSAEPDYLGWVAQITPSSMGRVAVLYGGVGSERAVSLVSGQAVFEALLTQGVDAVLVDTEKNPIEQLQAGRFDRAFNVLHGPVGEDGTILGALALLGIPCTGSDLASSALAMDKIRTKLIWQALGLATPPFKVAHSLEEAQAAAAEIGFPLVLKPVNQGSSVGVHVNIQEEHSLREIAEALLGTYPVILVERFIAGDDYFVGIVGQHALPSVLLVTKEAFYNYKAKYLVEDNQYICPGLASEAEEAACAQLCLEAYHALGCSGWGRLDLRRDVLGKLWLLEMNTVPGMTPHSLLPTAAQAAGVDFPTLVLTILSQTLAPEKARRLACEI